MLKRRIKTEATYESLVQVLAAFKGLPRTQLNATHSGGCISACGADQYSLSPLSPHLVPRPPFFSFSLSTGISAILACFGHMGERCCIF